MKKIVLIVSLVAVISVSCTKGRDQINECHDLAIEQLGNLDGFQQYNESFDSRDDLKLVVDDEFKDYAFVVSIDFKNTSDEFKGISCYYDTGYQLMGTKTNIE